MDKKHWFINMVTVINSISGYDNAVLNSVETIMSSTNKEQDKIWHIILISLNFS